jgi:hypothetical protein
METANNTYRLEQGDKEFIFVASIIGNALRLKCHNSLDENNKKYSQDFTVEQLNKINKLFTVIKTPEQALDYIDKALSDQKVGINEDETGLKLTFYITSKGVTNEIDIPLKEAEPSINDNNGNIPFQMGNAAMGQNKAGSLSNSAFYQNNQNNINISQNPNMNIYQSTQLNKNFDINQFMQNPQISSPTGNPTNQYVLNTSQYIRSYDSTPGTTQYMQSFQTYENTNNIAESAGNAQINLNDEEALKALGTTKVLPVQTTTRVLPLLGPFTDLKGLDIYGLANMNSQRNNNIPFQPVGNAQNIQNVQNQNIQIQQEKKVITKTNVNTNINKAKKSVKKKGLPQKKVVEKNESEEIKVLRSQLAELEPLKKRVAEMEVLRGQLTELNSLRAQVAEYNAVKGQLNEINNLRAQVQQFNSLKEQLPKLNELKMKEAENAQLKQRIKELELINQKNQEEINNLKSKLTLLASKNMMQDDNQEEEEITIKGDIIHNTEELEFLTKKINKLNQKLTLNLLYKASADTDTATAFHAKCDDAKSTIVLVETDKGKRFGGYTTCSWSGDCINKKDEEAFVFSFDKMKTYDSIPGEDSIGCYPKFGPIFMGCQIRIFNKAFTKGGTTYERGLNYKTEEDFELTGGDRVFNIKEIEVYEVIKE